MNINIVVKAVDVESNIPSKTGKSTYSKVTLTYKDLDSGKTQAKQFFSFANPDVYDKVKNMERESTYSVVMEKGEKYWEWVSVSEMSAQEVKQSMKTTSDTQLQIVRQSSLKAASEMLGAGREIEEYLELSDRLVNYVFTGQYVQMDDDTE